MVFTFSKATKGREIYETFSRDPHVPEPKIFTICVLVAMFVDPLAQEEEDPN